LNFIVFYDSFCYLISFIVQRVIKFEQRKQKAELEGRSRDRGI